MSWHTAGNRFAVEVSNPRITKTVYDKIMRANKLPLQGEAPGVRIAKRDQQSEFEKGIVTGDLVYVNAGEHKGTISTVISYTASTNTLYLSNVTQKSIIPGHLKPESFPSHLIERPKPVPFNQVKLAGKEKDENGKINYIVAEDFEFKEKYFDERYQRWLPRRVAKHHNEIEIPWPQPELLKDDRYSTQENIALEKSYEVQTIARPPIPREALAEFRNPYSKHKKRVFSELQVRRVNAPKMPLSIEQKIYLAKNEGKEKKVYQPLSEEIKEFIGSKMADHISKIDNPALLSHLDALSNSKIPDFEKTLANSESKSENST
ncbi:hypothetical protein DFJ63DRAFT_258202 [Scheffersomyces coipomensis]|uniref:uncharacterized protein n=1 Tax=Scheffersomyces coipomensis TaxID=1788519 RepID=UPI00315DB24B